VQRKGYPPAALGAMWGVTKKAVNNNPPYAPRHSVREKKAGSSPSRAIIAFVGILANVTADSCLV